jgi:hypothetical protein
MEAVMMCEVEEEYDMLYLYGEYVVMVTLLPHVVMLFFRRDSL